MNKFWKKYKIWLATAGYLILVLAIFGFAARPLIGKIKNNSDEIQKKIIDNEIIRSRISKIPEMKATSNLFAEKSGKLKVILKKDSEVEFIKKLESLAEETGNSIELKIIENNLKAQRDKEDKDDIKSNLSYNKFIILEINLEGGYQNLVNFIHKLENFSYYANIVRLSLAKNAPEQKVGALDNPFVLRNPAKSPLALQGKETIKSVIELAVYIKE